MKDLHELEVLLRSKTPLIVVETHEERRILVLLIQIAVKHRQPLFRWTATDGLQRADVELEPQRMNSRPEELLGHIKATTSDGIYVLMDFHPYLDEPLNIRQLKDIALRRDIHQTIVLVSHALKIPPEMLPFCARFELSVPDAETLERIVREEAREWAQANTSRRITTDRATLDRVVQNLQGLSLEDARRVARSAIANDGTLTESDLDDIQREKFELLSREGVLSFEPDTSRFSNIGGLDRLKQWLDIRRNVFTGNESVPGLDAPKGIVLLGVQGCGKSLAAKAVAGVWGVPLLRLDFGSLFNKFYGETERNLRESLKTAEAMTPCVLWIDEIEKGISSDDMDGGTSRRVFGTFLTWMAEHRASVFIVATANEIDSLPPELVRKGRFDEIFFVDLPDPETRKQILSIHLLQRELDPNEFTLVELARQCDGFSGAEIEQAVVSAMYTAHAQNCQLGSAHLTEEMARTQPLSVVMAERIARLRDWASSRTVPAH